MGDALKLLFVVTMQATGAGRGQFLWGKRFSQCNIAVLKLYCKSYWVL